MFRNTIRDGGSTALYTAYTVATVNNVDMVYTVDMVYSVDMVYTVDTVYTVDMVCNTFDILKSFGNLILKANGPPPTFDMFFLHC